MDDTTLEKFLLSTLSLCELSRDYYHSMNEMESADLFELYRQRTQALLNKAGVDMFQLPQRAFRYKGGRFTANIRYPPSVWHLQDPEWDPDKFLNSCCRRSKAWGEDEIEWKNLLDMTESDRLCTICFRPIMRPRED